MDKMREEFEAWHIKQCEADGMDLRDISIELDRSGDGYVYIGAQYAWRGWKASRAAMCIELPADISGEYYADGWNSALESVEEALKDCGVSCK